MKVSLPTKTFSYASADADNLHDAKSWILMQSDESSAAQGASANQREPTVPDEDDIWDGDSAVGGVRSYA